MAEVHERFTGLAEVYARCRPDYPPAALDYVQQRCQLQPGSVLVDVGCGTGISSRLFAQRGLQVIGIEPNADMRGQAEAVALPVDVPTPRYLHGTAEASGLPDASANAVLAAQAFHWFNAPDALREFQRILKPGGWVVLLWNERDERDPFTAAYGAIVAATQDAQAIERKKSRAGQALLDSTLFAQAERVTFPHDHLLDEEGLLGRALSVSYRPREPGAAARFAADLRTVFARFQQGGWVRMCYETSVTTGRKNSTV